MREGAGAPVNFERSLLERERFRCWAAYLAAIRSIIVEEFEMQLRTDCCPKKLVCRSKKSL